MFSVGFTDSSGMASSRGFSRPRFSQHAGTVGPCRPWAPMSHKVGHVDYFTTAAFVMA